jgi:hypothetical protein
MRRVLVLALAVVLAGSCGRKERRASELKFEELRDTSGLTSGGPLLRSVEASRMKDGMLRLHGRLDFPDGTRIQASVYRKDEKAMVARVQMEVSGGSFDSPPIAGPAGPLPSGEYRIEYLALFNPGWQPENVLESTDQGRRLHGPGITRDRTGGSAFFLVEERRL